MLSDRQRFYPDAFQSENDELAPWREFLNSPIETTEEMDLTTVSIIVQSEAVFLSSSHTLDSGFVSERIKEPGVPLRVIPFAVRTNRAYLVFGSNPSVADFYVGHESVYPLHAVVYMTEDGVYIQDLNSAHGTSIHGNSGRKQMIPPKLRHKLANGDRIQFGKSNRVYVYVAYGIGKVDETEDEFGAPIKKAQDLPIRGTLTSPGPLQTQNRLAPQETNLRSEPRHSRNLDTPPPADMSPRSRFAVEKQDNYHSEHRLGRDREIGSEFSPNRDAPEPRGFSPERRAFSAEPPQYSAPGFHYNGGTPSPSSPPRDPYFGRDSGRSADPVEASPGMPPWRAQQPMIGRAENAANQSRESPGPRDYENHNGSRPRGNAPPEPGYVHRQRSAERYDARYQAPDNEEGSNVGRRSSGTWKGKGVRERNDRGRRDGRNDRRGKRARSHSFGDDNRNHPDPAAFIPLSPDHEAQRQRLLSPIDAAPDHDANKGTVDENGHFINDFVDGDWA
mmetsp:Transcript_4246/g.7440  ORF Transcript_4246/g.7440 Transcript_4246/m.7440 type:complete len:504 (-) Transcript_4246:87-1598(-)|eukprot:CAMPEP_0182441970 /NCGR_PEP_ID=MMETSP1172-20130603/950_1 /TAXON_ID=708627 /ORGANISM="Timspurckia oligopyrenoides, Strain CCMP3278" /LENGTH=503 /DNA_ID=CAMNT_0024636597 /DNA_START=33 /DNA_END=1544 /DNA_ORIENTATION=-